MHPIQEDLEILRIQLGKGSIQKAYRALLSYMLGLRTNFVKKYGERSVSTIYQGYMDMTYFALFPPSLKPLNLKVAIVFNYDAFRFEVWLAARNRKIQQQYWELFKDRQWEDTRLVRPGEGIDAILERDLAADFDLSDPETLTSNIEVKTAAFINDIEASMAKLQPSEDDGLSGQAPN